MKSDFKVEMKGLSVMIGMPTTRDIPPETVRSIIGTMGMCSKLGVDSEFGFIAGCGVVQWARDEVIQLFLTSKASRLFWIDSDMVWEPEQFIRLLAFSTVFPVIGATYPAKREDQKSFYVNFDADKGLVHDEYGLFDVYGMGLGFTCMRREVVEALVAKAPKVIDQVNSRELASVFRIDRDAKGNRRGEDMAFFADILAAGFPVKLDPETDLGHIGTKTYTATIRDAIVQIP